MTEGERQGKRQSRERWAQSERGVERQGQTETQRGRDSDSVVGARERRSEVGTQLRRRGAKSVCVCMSVFVCLSVLVSLSVSVSVCHCVRTLSYLYIHFIYFIFQFLLPQLGFEPRKRACTKDFFNRQPC